MSSQVVIGSICVVGSGLLLWWAFFSDRKGMRAKASLQSATSTDAPTFRDLNLGASATERLFAPVAAGTLRRVRRLTPSGSLDAMQRRINLAGAQNQWTVERLLSAKILLAVAVFFVCVLFAVASGSVGYLIAAVVLGFVAYLVPDGLIDRRADQRQQDLQDDMPDVIDQIMISVQAGLSFDGAMARVASTNKGPFAEELEHVVQDIRLGLSRAEALRRFAERTSVREIDEFVVAVNQAEAYGLSISTVLKVQSEDLREQRKQRAEERAHKVGVKLTIPLVFCIFPCLFIAIMGPALIQAFRIDL